jgi:hypothetical protein
VTSVRCTSCLYSFHGETVAVRDRYLAHIPVCPVIAATTTPTSSQAADFLALSPFPAGGERVEAGENAPATTGEQVAASGAPTGDGGGASSGVVSPDAAAIRPLFRWIGERNARPLRWWL